MFVNWVNAWSSVVMASRCRERFLGQFLGHGPTLENNVFFQPEIVVQRAGLMPLYQPRNQVPGLAGIESEISRVAEEITSPVSATSFVIRAGFRVLPGGSVDRRRWPSHRTQSCAASCSRVRRTSATIGSSRMILFLHQLFRRANNRHPVADKRRFQVNRFHRCSQPHVVFGPDGGQPREVATRAWPWRSARRPRNNLIGPSPCANCTPNRTVPGNRCAQATLNFVRLFAWRTVPRVGDQIPIFGQKLCCRLASGGP